MANITKRSTKARPKPGPQLGDTRGEGQYTFVGADHPLVTGKSTGWVLTHRLDAYNRQGGVATCDDRTEASPAVEWHDVRVVGGRLACHYHGRIRAFAQYLLDQGLMSPAMSRELASLLSQPCRGADKGG